MGPSPCGWTTMVRLVHRQLCCVPMTVEPWSMSLTMVIKCQMSKACESIAEMSMWHWRSIAGSQPDERHNDFDCKVTLTFGSTLNAAFGIFRCLIIKPDNYRTLLTKLKSWSIHQDFWNILLSWWCRMRTLTEISVNNVIDGLMIVAAQIFNFLLLRPMWSAFSVI